MTAALSPPLFNCQFFTDAGAVAAGYYLYTYVSGTTTNQTTYTDAAGTIQNANPIVLDSAGRCALWLGSGLTYTFVLKTSGGTTIWTRDGVAGVPASVSGSYVPLAGGTMTGLLVLSGNATSNLNAVPLQQVNSLIATANAALTTAVNAAVPIGTIAMWLTSTAPTNWLTLNGAAVSRTTYATLFSLWGTTYGTGDGSTTFNLPDVRGEFPRFWDNSRGVDSGRALGSAQTADIAAHTHALSTLGKANADGNDNLTDQGLVSSSVGAAGALTNITASSSGSETRPRNFSLMAMVKAL